MTAIISLFLANLPALIKGGEALAAYVMSMKSALAQNAEWTTEHEQQYQDQLANDINLPQSKTDAELGL